LLHVDWLLLSFVVQENRWGHHVLGTKAYASSHRGYAFDVLIIERRTWHFEVIFNPYTIIPASDRIKVQWIKLMELVKLIHVFGVQGVATMDVLNCFLSLSTETFGVCLTTSFNLLRRIILVYARSPLGSTGNLKVLFEVLCWCHGS